MAEDNHLQNRLKSLISVDYLLARSVQLYTLRITENKMKAKLLLLTLLAGSAAFARTHFAFGFGFGYPVVAPPVVAYAPPPVVAYAPAPVYPVYPAANYAWIAGYYYPVGTRWAWRPGYWARRPFAGAAWVAPRYAGGRWFAGHWRR